MLQYFVVDADAIESLKGMDCKGKVVITPHAGEFKKLTGIELPTELEERKKIENQIVQYATLYYTVLHCFSKNF